MSTSGEKKRRSKYSNYVASMVLVFVIFCFFAVISIPAISATKQQKGSIGFGNIELTIFLSLACEDEALNELEQKRLLLQDRLDAAKTQGERNRMGQFATPSQLAKQVVAAG